MASSWRKVLVLLLTGALVFSVAGCAKEEAEPAESEAEEVETGILPDKEITGEPIKVALGGIITPKSALSYYNDLLDYISRKTGRPIELLDEEDYTAINEMMEAREADVGFVCAGPYADAHDTWGMELLCAPQVEGESVYYSYFIVGKDSPAASLDDLKGKAFAFTDPKSNTGKLVPTYHLARQGNTPESFFSSVVFTGGHDKSIAAVANGEVDGAAVDSLIWEYQNATDPTNTEKTKVIYKAGPFGIPPITVHPEMDAQLKADLRAAFLQMADDPEGQEILKNMNIEMFVEVEDSAYDSVREMTEWLAANPIN